jgi:hypothetical protein
MASREQYFKIKAPILFKVAQEAALSLNFQITYIDGEEMILQVLSGGNLFTIRGNKLTLQISNSGNNSLLKVVTAVNQGGSVFSGIGQTFDFGEGGKAASRLITRIENLLI